MQPQNQTPKPPATAPAKPAPPQALPVRPAPADSEHGQVATQQPARAAAKPKPVKSSQAPVGVIAFALVIMVGLSALAIAVYMTTKR